MILQCLVWFLLAVGIYLICRLGFRNPRCIKCGGPIYLSTDERPSGCGDCGRTDINMSWKTMWQGKM